MTGTDNQTLTASTGSEKPLAERGSDERKILDVVQRLGTLRTADNAIKVIKQEQRSMLIRGFRNGISKLQYDQSHCPMHSS